MRLLLISVVLLVHADSNESSKEMKTEVRSATPDGYDYDDLDCEDAHYALYDPNCVIQRIEANRGQNLVTYRQWESWSACSETGTQTRRRTCETGDCAEDSLTEHQGPECIQKRDEWTEWSDCDNQNSQVRFRKCLPDLLVKCRDLRQFRDCPEIPSKASMCTRIIDTINNGNDLKEAYEICNHVQNEIKCRLDVMSVKTDLVRDMGEIFENGYCDQKFKV